MLKTLFVLILALVAVSGVRLLNEGAEIVPGSFIAVLHPHVSLAQARLLKEENQVPHLLHIGNFKALAGQFIPGLLEKFLTRDDIFKYIEADRIVRISHVTQNNATWGLDRIDQQRLPLDSMYRYFESAGEGVDAYIIDTGVLNTHEEFEGRARSGYDFHNNKEDATDDNGHGTHCAGTVGGKVNGVAKKVNIIGVKTLGRFGAGNLLNVARGVEWAAQQHRTSGRRSVANMSLGGPSTQALDDAVAAAIETGLVVVVASGNSDEDACNTSPARVPTAITVNACNATDSRAFFSNFGPCTTLFAPGQDITSAWITSNTAYNTISGTSMACPHVCGAAAVILGQMGPMTPAEVKATLISKATPNVLADVKGSPNLLLYSPYQ